MSTLPVALTPKKTLLIGAGKAAALKARALKAAGFELQIVAREITDSFFDAQEVRLEPFKTKHLAQVQAVVDASGNDEVLAAIKAARGTYRFWLNVVDKPAECDFYFCATAKRGDLQVAVTSGGASPLLAQSVRDCVDRLLPTMLENETALLKQLRQTGQKPDPKTLEKLPLKVQLIGCGPGSADNLTLRAYRAIGSLQVALYDALITPEVLALLPDGCEKIDVSKQKGRHSKSQEEINDLLLKYVREGKSVGRLKGGDPVIFGRAAEESAFLAANGIECEVVPGISSALAAGALGGIFPTARGVASSLSIVSAHLRETFFNDAWIDLLKRPDHTVIVLMAHSFAGKIRAAALEAGVSPALGAAFVSRVDRPDQSVTMGTLEELERMAARCEKPAVLILGNIVTRSV